MQTNATPTATKTLLACGAAAGLIFTICWLIAGSISAGYDPLRHAISSLSTLEFGWIQIASFIITGLLLIAFSLGLRRALQPAGTVWMPRLVAVVGIGLIGAGIFVTDPLNGYPPGTNVLPLERTTPGILHDLFSALFFLGVPIASFVGARLFARLGWRGPSAYSLLSGIAMLALFTVARLGFRLPAGSFDLLAYFGLLQRVVVTTGFAWLMWLAVYLLLVKRVSPVSTTA